MECRANALLAAHPDGQTGVVGPGTLLLYTAARIDGKNSEQAHRRSRGLIILIVGVMIVWSAAGRCAGDARPHSATCVVVAINYNLQEVRNN